MKKSLSLTLRTFLIVALMIVPCVFMLAACGAPPTTANNGTYKLQSFTIDGKTIVITDEMKAITAISNTPASGTMPAITVTKPTTTVKMPTLLKPAGYPSLTEPAAGASAEAIADYAAQQSWIAYEENVDDWANYNAEVYAQDEWKAEQKAYENYVMLMNTLIDAGFTPDIAPVVLDVMSILQIVNSIQIMIDENKATILMPPVKLITVEYFLVGENVMLDLVPAIQDLLGEQLGGEFLMDMMGGMLGSMPIEIKYISGKLVIGTVKGLLPITMSFTFAK
ncbi:MAG: hypothetical protein LBN07_02585 [Christensenellaceae bacterium]|jgi:hypothetical protein|nr:hypothetical protein [Christensenellaceae bacterium]